MLTSKTEAICLRLLIVVDTQHKKRQFPDIPRGASDDAEMALSRTLEPDPGHTGVGTEQSPLAMLFYSSLNLDLPDETSGVHLLWRVFQRHR